MWDTAAATTTITSGSELAQYDDYYKAVVDALKETGTYEETLIVSNADHGGSGYNHGSMDPSNMDIFIGLGDRPWTLAEGWREGTTRISRPWCWRLCA